MQINILVFGIIKDIIKSSSFLFSIEKKATVADLKTALISQYPDFSKLKYLRVSVNNEYKEDHFILKQCDEIALIPPVSGG